MAVQQADSRRKWPGYNVYTPKVSVKAKHCDIALVRLILTNVDKRALRKAQGRGPRAQGVYAGRKIHRKSENFRVSSHPVSDLSKNKNGQVREGPASEWMVGDGGISIERLVLVSLRRVSVGCWVPRIRLANGPGLVSSHELSLVCVIRQLMIFI